MILKRDYRQILNSIRYQAEKYRNFDIPVFLNYE